jgi:hypothetical protein
MTEQAIERVADKVMAFYELPTTPCGVAATFVEIYRLILRLLKCPPAIAFEVTATCFPCEYRAFLASVAHGDSVTVEKPHANRHSLIFPELN